MIEFIRTHSDHPDFILLVKQLDQYLAEIDGDEHAFYAQYNKIDKIQHVIIACDNNQPVGCGAIKEYVTDTMEIKRMYTLPEKRGRGIATIILHELEKWAIELSYSKCILETGNRQQDAIALYQKNGYMQIPNYGQYAGVENSVCFEKNLLQE